MMSRSAVLYRSAPSSRSSAIFVGNPSPPENPPRLFAATTRWQGIRIGIGLAPQALPTGCAADPTSMKKKGYTEIRSESIRSILVVPVVNNTVAVNAPDYLLSTVAVPLAEHGYYVFPVNLVKRVMEEEPVRVRTLAPGVDRDLETIVLKCMDKESARRYASAQDLAADLGRYLEGDPIQARPPSLVYLLRKRVAKRKALVGTAVGAAVLLIAVASYLL